MFVRFTAYAFVSAIAVSTVAKADFLPPNDLAKEDGLLRDANLTEAEFNRIIDVAETVIGSKIADHFQAQLKVNRLWTDTTVNASAIQFGTRWEVNMYGGLARRPEITQDGFALVLCHEIGHHLGGYPFRSDWAANEGESDYFASHACPRMIWKDDLAVNATFRDTVEAAPKALCDQVWTTVEDQNLCYRVMTGAKSTADMASVLGNSKASWATPDKKVVNRTDNNHPAGQCRLDTYAAGALCTKTFDEAVIPGKDLGWSRNGKDGERAATQYSCTQFENFQLGFRPLCWFKPALKAGDTL